MGLEVIFVMRRRIEGIPAALINLSFRQERTVAGRRGVVIHGKTDSETEDGNIGFFQNKLTRYWNTEQTNENELSDHSVVKCVPPSVMTGIFKWRPQTLRIQYSGRTSLCL